MTHPEACTKVTNDHRESIIPKLSLFFLCCEYIRFAPEPEDERTRVALCLT